VGRAARPSQHRDARLVEHPAVLAGGRTAAGLRARPCTRSRACGQASRPWSWPTWPRRPSPR
jgi:hypothetical protein